MNSLVFLYRLCGVVVLGLVAGCQESKPPAETPRVVKLEQAVPAGRIESRFAASVRQEERATLAFESGGRIVSIDVDVGDHVRAGQVLARVDVGPSTYRLQQAEANVKAARAELRDHQSQLSRQQAQFHDGALSAVSMTSAQAATDTAQAKLAAYEAEADVARRAVRMAVIRAPFDGDVVSRLQQPANDVAPGQPVFQLEGGGQLQLVAMLPERVAASLSVGAPAHAYSKDLEKTVHLRLRGISTRSEVGGVREAIFDVVEDKIALRNGAALLLTLPSSEGEVLSVPLTSVIRGSDDIAWVYVYDSAKNEVRQRPVRLGPIEGNHIQVLHGLGAGEWVVGVGASFMVDGQKATPLRADTRLVDGAAP